MGIYFLDTCALKHRYVAIDPAVARRVRWMVSEGRYEHFIADVTVVEIAGALASSCRAAGLGVAEFDSMDRAFFRDVSVGRLQIRATGQREALRARTLLRFAGVKQGRNLGSSDAVIASACLILAQERQTKVIFYTADWALYSVLHDIDAFRAAMCLRYLGAPKGGMRGSTC